MCVIVNMHSHTLTRWIYEIKACNLIQQMQNITLKMKMKNRARETHTQEFNDQSKSIDSTASKPIHHQVSMAKAERGLCRNFLYLVFQSVFISINQSINQLTNQSI